jgi:hypothetical protein
MAKHLLSRLKTKRILYWLLVIFLGVNPISFTTGEKAPKKPDHLLTTQTPLSVHYIGLPSFDNDPIRFTMRTDKQRVALGEEVTLIITAHYLNISPALLFITDGANAFRLKVLMPDGFVQTGGDYIDYVGTKLSASVAMATYTLRGYFTKAVSPNEFRLLRGQANADANSLFVEKAQVKVQVNEAVSNQQKMKGAREGALSFQIVSYDCNSGVLQYQFISSDGSPVNVTMPGVFGGTMNPNSVASYTFPDDGRQGRTVTGTASQNGDQISISFTTSCNLSSGQSPNPTPNQPSNPPTNSGSCSVSNPTAYLDYADCNGVGGWAMDQNNMGQPVLIDIYVDGVKTYAGITANGNRQDLVNAFGNPAAQYHGFSYQFPSDAFWKNGQNHTIVVRICGVGNDINGSPKTVNCSGGSQNPGSPSSPSNGCGTGNGLTGLYYNGSDVAQGLSAGRIDGQINFIWNDSPIPGKVNADGFSVRWLGQVEAPVSGNYIFKTNNDDGTRLWVNGQLLIDDWIGHGPTWQQGSIYLNAGQKYDLEMDFFDAWGGAQAQLYWEYPGQGIQLVPTCRLHAIAADGQTYRTASPSGNWCHYDDGCISYDYRCDSKQAFNLEFHECYTTTVGGGTGNNPTTGNPGGSPISGNPGTGSGNPSTPDNPTITGSRVPTTAHMDGIDCDKISGWAFANSGGYAYLDIYAPDVYSYGTGRMVKVATIKANNVVRSDVRAAYGNNPNIPLDCGFVWAIPDIYKIGKPVTIQVVPVNDVSSISNSPLTSTGDCNKPGTNQGGTTGPPSWKDFPNLKNLSDQYFLNNYVIAGPERPINIAQRLNCFGTIPDDPKYKYSVTLYVDQPVNGTREIANFDPSSSYRRPGHTYIGFERYDSSTGQVVRLVAGFYVQTEWIAATGVSTESAWGDDGNTRYDVSLKIDLSASNFKDVIYNIKNLGNPKYNLVDNNCTTFACKVISPYISLPNGKGYIGPLGQGYNPADLGQDLRENAAMYGNKVTVADNSISPSSTNCN